LVTMKSKSHSKELMKFFSALTIQNPGSSFLDGVMSNCIMDCDITQSDSYDPGVDAQLVKNLIANPSDGELKAAMDLQFGNTGAVDAADPIYVGTGAGDIAGYTEHNGIGAPSFPDKPKLTLAGSNTPFLNSLHRDDAGGAQKGWTVIMAIRRSEPGFGSASLWGTRTKFTSPFTSGSGMLVDMSAGGFFAIQQRGDSSTRTISGGAGAIDNSEDYLIGYRWTPTAPGSPRFFTDVNNTKSILTPSAPVTSTMDANAPFAVMIRQGGGNDDWRFYGCYIFDKQLNDSHMEIVFDHIRTRHARLYEAL